MAPMSRFDPSRAAGLFGGAHGGVVGVLSGLVGGVVLTLGGLWVLDRARGG